MILVLFDGNKEIVAYRQKNGIFADMLLFCVNNEVVNKTVLLIQVGHIG